MISFARFENSRNVESRPRVLGEPGRSKRRSISKAISSKLSNRASHKNRALRRELKYEPGRYSVGLAI